MAAAEQIFMLIT